MGVFAPLTGVIGAMQAMEAIKLVAGVGESLDGRLHDLRREERRVAHGAGQEGSCLRGVRQEIRRLAWPR